MSAIYKAINAIQAELSKEGIAKGRKNAQQGYNFRGIDDMYNTLAPLLAKHGLVVTPSYSERQVVERESKSQTALFYVTLRGDFTFYAAEDGSKVSVATYGEAMDSGDKATNKAMSAALKYALMQTFTIPTEGDNDTENQTHEVKTGVAAFKHEALKSLSFEEQELTRLAAADSAASMDEGPEGIERAYNAIRAKHLNEDDVRWPAFLSALDDIGKKYKTLLRKEGERQRAMTQRQETVQ